MSVKGSSSSGGSAIVTPPATFEKNLRMVLPDTYSGERTKLKAYLLQSELFIGFNSTKFNSETEQVLWASSLLRGGALNWIEPFLTDYMDHKNAAGQVTAGSTDETIKIFQTWKGFKEKITRVFGDIDQERTAERHLQNLRQKGPATSYTAEFQQYMGKTDWNDEALKAQYYRGLKDVVKDEISRSDRPDDLQEMIEMAIRVDNRMYERSLERRGHYSMPNTRKGKGRGNYGGSWPQPMELDATYSKPKGKPSKETMDKRRRDKLCFECGLPGHMAQSHRDKPTQRGKKPWKGRQQLNATQRGEICAMERRSESWLEANNIGTQIESSTLQEESEPEEESEEDPPSEESEEESSGDERAMLTSPDGEPTVGQVWRVTRREDAGRYQAREWQDLATEKTYQEPDVGPGGPEYGETYEVVYRDHKRIAWKQVNQYAIKTYTQHLEKRPRVHFNQDEPKAGEFWELVSQDNWERMWQDCQNDKRWFWEDKREGGLGLATGNVHQAILLQDGTRGWADVLTGLRVWELCATGGNGQLSYPIRINGERLWALIDSGSTGNFMSPQTVSKMRVVTELKEEPYELTLIDGNPIEIAKGTIACETTVCTMAIGTNHQEEIRFDLAPLGRHMVVLGMPWIKKHNPSVDWVQETLKFDRCDCQIGQAEICAISREPRHDGKSEGKQDAKGLLVAKTKPVIPEEFKEFKDMFIEKEGKDALPPHAEWDHVMPLEEGKTPPFGGIYSHSAEDLGTLREYIATSLEKGWIRESNSPAASPVLFVPKPDGSRRLCVDYRALNNITIKDRYPLPLPEEMRDRLQGAKIFTQLDIRNAYQHIRIKEGEEWKTAFRTRYGLYEYCVMPFGLTNAPATFQRRIHNILRRWLDVTCICYLDDILIYSSNEEEHTNHVKTILKALQQAGISLKGTKCHFRKKEVTFLGFIVNTEGTRMDPRKVQTVLDWSIPRNVKDVQSFLGFANFYRRFIKGYSGIATPLTALTKKDQEFKWTTQADKAFQELKQAFTQEPLLLVFDPERAILVETDSSDYAIGAVLSQKGDNNK